MSFGSGKSLSALVRKRVFQGVFLFTLISFQLVTAGPEVIDFSPKKTGDFTSFKEQRLAEKLSSKRPKTAESRIQPKIVGGGDARAGTYPWVTALLERSETDRFLAQFCGAALIHPYWVLTAAHCVEGDRAENIDVLIGARDLDNFGEGERIEVVEILIHPEFDNVSLDADVALLRLAVPSTRPVLRLNSDAALEMPDTLATILGWGALDEANDRFPSVLQEALVPLVDFLTADVAYGNTLTERMLAAGNMATGGVDSCSGDSGGPLVVMDTDGAWALTGITSFGDGCGRPDSPGIYTRVSEFRSWAIAHIWPRFDDWERGFSVFGETRNSDGDDWSNFSEFAFGGNPMTADGGLVYAVNSGGEAKVRFDRPSGSEDDIDYAVEYRGSLGGNWIVLPWASMSPKLVSAGAMETVELSFPEAESGFLRLTPSPSVGLSPALRRVSAKGETTSALDSSAQVDGLGRSYLEFVFPEQALGSPITYVGRSDHFDVALELRDGADGFLLADSNADNAGGTDESLRYTPSAEPPVLRVLAASPGAGGAFSIFAGEPPSADGTIGPNQTRNASLSSSDEFDPVFLPSQYYKRDYALLVPPSFSGTVRITMTSPDWSTLDPYLSVIDSLTGAVLVENDDMDFDGGNYDARIDYEVDGQHPILIRVSTPFELEVGPFTLSTQTL